MHRYLLRRVVAMLPVLLGVMTVVFLALRLIPGDPAVALEYRRTAGGLIRRLSTRLDPRHCRVWPIGPPTPDEQGRHYL